MSENSGGELRPVLTGELFHEIRRELVSLLKGLSEEDWSRPTTAGKWNVKDVALHILGGDVGNLSRRRDAFSLKADLSSYEKLVAFINEINASWVAAGQRMSASVLIDLLEHVGRQMDDYYAGLDPFAMGGPVEWVGGRPMPVWFDVAREYTERWHHQQQIRDATGRPGLYEGRLFEPVMDTFVRALPWTFRSLKYKQRTTVVLKITGALSRQWELERSARGWELRERSESAPAQGAQDSRPRMDARVTLKAEDAWKIFTKGIRGEEAWALAEIDGDIALAQKVLETVAVIA